MHSCPCKPAGMLAEAFGYFGFEDFDSGRRCFGSSGYSGKAISNF